MPTDRYVETEPWGARRFVLAQPSPSPVLSALHEAALSATRAVQRDHLERAEGMILAALLTWETDAFVVFENRLDAPPFEWRTTIAARETPARMMTTVTRLTWTVGGVPYSPFS